MRFSKSTVLLLGLLLSSPAASRAQWGGPTPVRTEAVAELDLAPVLELPGTALPFRKTSVAAAEEGKVVERVRGYFSVAVEPGDVLVRLDDERAQARLAEAQAQAGVAEARLAELEAGERKETLQEARAEVRRAAAAKTEAESNLERVRDLERRKASTRDQLDQAVRQAAVTKEELSAAQSRLARLEAGSRREELARARAELAVEQARVAFQKKVLDDHVVRAPYKGIVDVVAVEVGSWVGQGGTVVDLVDNSWLDLAVLVPEDQIARLTLGTTAPVQFVGEDTPRTAKVAALGAQATMQGRTVPIIVRLPNADGTLRAGQSARVLLTLGKRTKRLAVPKDAVLRDSSGATRVVLAVGGKAQPRPVRLGIEALGYFEILEGVAPGDRVVVRGNERLRGDQEIVEESATGKGTP